MIIWWWLENNSYFFYIRNGSFLGRDSIFNSGRVAVNLYKD